MIDTAHHFGKYLAEFLKNRGKNIETILGSKDPLLTKTAEQEYGKTRLALFGLLGTHYYDLTLTPQEVKKREFVRTGATQLITLLEYVDDIIDKGTAPLEQKFKLLDKGKAALLGYKQSLGQTDQETIALHIASIVHEETVKYDKRGKLEYTLDKLIPVIKDQFLTTTVEEALHTNILTGQYCFEFIARLTEIATHQDHPDIITAAQKTGESAQLHDITYEIDDDIAEGVNTYATMVLRQKGDTKKTRREIQAHLKELSQEAYTQGINALSTPTQKAQVQALFSIYKTAFALKNIIHPKVKNAA